MVRQCCQSVQKVRLLGFLQLGLVTARKGAPSGAVVPDPGLTHQRSARGQIRQPDVEPVAACILRLANAARRTPNRTEAQPLATPLPTPQSDDADCHRRSFSAPD